MALPLIIQYSEANLNSLGHNVEDFKRHIKEPRKCKIYYYEPQNTPRVRIDIEGFNYSIIVSIGKERISFVNPWFRKSSQFKVSSEPAFEEEYIIIAENRNTDVISLIIDRNYSLQLPEIKNFVQKCFLLQKPVVAVHKDKEREIWAAYCDGLNALNKEKRNFITIDYFSKPILFNDTRQGEIYTMKLGVAKQTLEDLPNRVNDLLKDRFNVSSTEIKGDDEVFVNIGYFSNLREDDLEQLNKLFSEYGYTLSDKPITNILKCSISLGDVDKSKVPEYQDEEAIDLKLDDNSIEYTKHGAGIYYFYNDGDLDKAHSCIKTITENKYDVNVRKSISISHDLSKNMVKDAIFLSKGREGLNITNDNFIIEAKNKNDYDRIGQIVQNICNELKVKVEIPKFHHKMKISKNKNTIFRDLKDAEEQLTALRKLCDNCEFNEENGYVIRYEFRFSTPDERADLITQIEAQFKTLSEGYKLTLKNRKGQTRISYVKDAKSMEIIEEDLRQNYQNEEIKLVDGNLYNKLFGKITDTENIIDPSLRERYNRFIQECPTIGTCHKRTYDSIIVKLSEDFYKGETLGQQIRKGDMIFFPSVGTSTELRRQYEAIQRINRPGEKLPFGKTIEPPVNNKLCDFLFSPLYADGLTGDVEQMINRIKENRLEYHLNDKQIEAVAKSLLAPDIAFIQGPPGTGKTTVIAEIIWQEIRRNPKCKILLTSQTNLAVDNALERLKYQKNIRPLRVASEQKGIDENMMYNPALLDSWAERPSDDNKGNIVDNWIDQMVEKINNLSVYQDITQEWRDYLAEKGITLRKDLVKRYKSSVNLIAATCSLCGSMLFRTIFERMYDTDKVAFDVVIMDEASKATPLEMAIPMVLGKKIIVIGDHKQLPPVLDENSIDTALKKIGREDLATRIQEFKDSQFKKLFQMALKFKPELVTTLDTQYRMHKDIMMTINQFYVDELGDTGLKCGIEDVMDNADLSLRGSRYHGISCEPFISPSTHAVWVNVEGTEEKDFTSYKNMEEIEALKDVIHLLCNSDGFSDFIQNQTKIEDKEIGLITFYSAQRNQIRNLLNEEELGDSNDYRVDVVDRFQGMERNIVIVSTVRSNRYNGVGFAKEIERINVAFSRARRLLIVIGNRNLFANQYNYKSSISAMETIDFRQIKDMIRNEK